MPVEVSTNSLGGIRAVLRLEGPRNVIVEVSISPLEGGGSGLETILEESELAVRLDLPRLVEGKFDQVADLLQRLYERASSSPGRFITTIRIEREGELAAGHPLTSSKSDFRPRTAFA